MSAIPTPIKESLREPRAGAARPSAERVVSSRELLGSATRIWIEHATERYLLQVTRSGKLILTK
jgi:hemin uptake protein HemP